MRELQQLEEVVLLPPLLDLYFFQSFASPHLQQQIPRRGGGQMAEPRGGGQLADQQLRGGGQVADQQRRGGGQLADGHRGGGGAPGGGGGPIGGGAGGAWEAARGDGLAVPVQAAVFLRSPVPRLSSSFLHHGRFHFI